MERKNGFILALLVIISLLLIIIITLLRRPTIVTQEDHTKIDKLDKKGRLYKDPYEQHEVKNTLTKNETQIKDCYLEFMKTYPPITDGKVTMDWQVTPDGKVSTSEVVSSEINNPILENCLVNTIKAWVFPPPPYGRSFYTSYTYVFKNVVEAKVKSTNTTATKP